MEITKDTNDFKITGFFLISFPPYPRVPFCVPVKARHSLTKNSARENPKAKLKTYSPRVFKALSLAESHSCEILGNEAEKSGFFLLLLCRFQQNFSLFSDFLWIFNSPRSEQETTDKSDRIVN